MTDIIKLLPDAIANQIAAGEVVQRPASVVKELVDNALDAGATKIDICVEEAGKNLIRIVDNGIGMSMTDARMAFERHATSKITNADDLFAIRTKGFRGEALASIAAVATIELKTKRKEDALGTKIVIQGSELITQEQIACETGSQFLVKNLFFNIPARRKFLKTDATELRHIINEFQRLALAHPDIEMRLTHGDAELHNLHGANLKQRIVNLFQTSIQAQLIKIESETSYARLSGYVGKPMAAKKRFGEQFFFANNRYIRHPYLHKAVMEAYGQLLATQTIPLYFIFIEVDPGLLDVNIHPTKTEVKFEDERTLFQLVLATVKEALGKHNIVPSIDFEMHQGIDIPVKEIDRQIKTPQISDNPNYNPFEKPISFQRENRVPKDWEKFYDFENATEIESEPIENSEQLTLQKKEDTEINILQIKGKYILSPVKSGIMFIHQNRATERILFERLMKMSVKQSTITQRLLFPHIISLSTTDMVTFENIREELLSLGFDIDLFSKDEITINGLPGGVTIDSPQEFMEELLEDYRGKEVLQNKLTESVVTLLAKKTARRKNGQLTIAEAQQLMADLFSCEAPNYTPDNKSIIFTMSIDDIEKHFV